MSAPLGLCPRLEAWASESIAGCAVSTQWAVVTGRVLRTVFRKHAFWVLKILGTPMWFGSSISRTFSVAHTPASPPAALMTQLRPVSPECEQCEPPQSDSFLFPKLNSSDFSFSYSNLQPIWLSLGKDFFSLHILERGGRSLGWGLHLGAFLPGGKLLMEMHATESRWFLVSSPESCWGCAVEKAVVKLAPNLAPAH